MKNYLQLLRVHQYIKNLFIFLPIFFGLKMMEFPLVIDTIAAFLLFSMLASSIYIFNDLFDCEDDRKHPAKKERPLASGAISKRKAVVIMAVLMAVSGAGAFLYDRNVLYLMLLYVVINVLYTLLLKHVALIDVMIIAVGFVLRLFIGSVVTGIHLSMWIIIMTFLLALFLAFGKRRDDVILYIEKGDRTRRVIDGYNIEFLNVTMIVLASIIVISYIMYTISPLILERVYGDKIYLTVIWVILGMFRYLQQAFVFNNSASPTNLLLKDSFLQVVLVCWIISFWFLIYFNAPVDP